MVPRVEDQAGYLWIEAGERREGVIADVAPIVAYTHRTYAFAVPTSIEATLKLGQRVTVPLGRRGRAVPGFVVGIDRGVWDSTLRPIESVIDQDSFLNPELIALGREIAAHYTCPLGKTLKAITPEAVRRQCGLKKVRYAALARPVAEILAEGRRLSAPRRALLERLAEAEGLVRADRLLSDTGATPAVLRAMAAQGWVAWTVGQEADEEEATPVPPVPDFELNAEQGAALDAVRRSLETGTFSTTLLFGVSGSGKTEVYIHAIRRVVAAGRQAILLVPEIVLTTQIVQRLAARLPDVAVTHSGLTDAQRAGLWRQAAAGAKKVIIGTRSAVFAPCPDLGLICVDEEQETSYKNLQAPRFHVRDVAIMRARLRGIPAVLGSATPSLESWYHSGRRPDWQRVILRHRVQSLPLPTVHVVDMRDEHAELKSAVILSRTMERFLGETLQRREQALILMNRRGFARRVHCPACRARLECPRCAVALVAYASGELRCHYCRWRGPLPNVCPNPSCGEPLVKLGLGTQRIEEVLLQRFPGVRLQRVDSDTMRHRSHYQRIVDDFEARRVDLLVGTQMIAKGLDFPHVSFVGVVDADPPALAGDFRAEERLFQLITQVAGRAGRADASGRVVVQTTMPELAALRCALRHDYESFAEAETAMRRKVGLPPFRRIARLVLAHRREGTARQEAEALAERVQEAARVLGLAGADVLGPSPCPLARLRGKYRYDLLVRTANASGLRLLMGHLQASRALRTRAESTLIDVDPVSLT